MTTQYVPGAIYTEQVQINMSDHHYTKTIRDLNTMNSNQYKTYESHAFPSNDLYISKYRVGRIVGMEFPKDHVILKIIMDGNKHVESYCMCLNVAKRTRLVDDRIIVYTCMSRNEWMQMQDSD